MATERDDRISKEPDISACGKCGEFACQSFDDRLGPRQEYSDRAGRTRMGRPVLGRRYYCHCFNGDCGAEGPRSSDSAESIRLWNAQQVRKSK